MSIILRSHLNRVHHGLGPGRRVRYPKATIFWEIVDLYFQSLTTSPCRTAEVGETAKEAGTEERWQRTRRHIGVCPVQLPLAPYSLPRSLAPPSSLPFGNRGSRYINSLPLSLPLLPFLLVSSLSPGSALLHLHSLPRAELQVMWECGGSECGAAMSGTNAA
jgi:hypothetical protein